MPHAGAILWWSAVLIALLIVALIAVAQVKKRLMNQDEPASGGFTLADLRDMHRQGRMSDAEFERAKEVIVTAARKTADRKTPGVRLDQRGNSNQTGP